MSEGAQIIAFPNRCPPEQFQIPLESFNRLKQLVHDTNEQLGIYAGDHHHAHSPVLNTEPEVTLATYTSADNDVIEVAFGDTRGRTIILAEDTGQVGAPDRIKATELTLNKNDQPDVASNMPRQLSGPEFRFVVGVLKQRAFSKRSDRLYLSKATAS